MSALKDYRKADLIALAEELEVDLSPSDKIVTIIKKIEGSPDYDEALAIAQIKLIYEDRKKEGEIERQERERVHELEKLKLTQLNETSSINSEREEKPRLVSLKSVMQKFDPDNSEISLFLTLFQRHATKAGLAKDEWVTQLLSLLPVKIAEQIIREPEERLDDYDYIKGRLLDRFKINAETFRKKFTQCQKTQTELWRDILFQLRTYLEGWLTGLQITDFEGLKNLLLCDQLKRRASPEMREKFLDSWSEFVDPEKLVGKFDDYETVRRPHKKPVINKGAEERRTDRVQSNGGARERKLSEKKPFNWRDKNAQEQRERERVFEKRKPPACYECGSIQHLRPSCPKLKKPETHQVGLVEGFGASFEPYLSKALVNDTETIILRDSGSSIDLAPRKLISLQHLNGEEIWVKQPLENTFRCLPVANIELKIPELGIISTKAAIVDSSVEMDHYLLGNQTQELIDARRPNPERINTVITRSQKRKGESVDRDGEGEGPEAEISDHGECALPEPTLDHPAELVQIPPDQFREAQREDRSLKVLWEKGEEEKCAEFRVENGTLFRIAKDHRGEKRKQLVVPSKLRNKILTLCHEGVASHMGTTKTKDKLLRWYFWPNVIKETEEFVKTCHSCQIVGKAGETKKAPLKLVPIIGEVFARLNCDITGPLPESDNNNKYLLTAMCLASKYPEAIPLANIKSESVIDALLIVFSRLGFPKEVQCDLGTCFTSTLTSVFFEKFGIKVIHSSVHRPQSNAIERWHRSVKRLLKVLCVENGKSWEKNLPFALLALRTVTHESTGYSPAELIHGRNLRTPETLLFEKWTDPAEEENLVTEYVFTLINRLKRCQEFATERMEIARDKRK